MAKQGSFQYVPLFSPEFNPVKDRKKLDPPRWKNFDRQEKEVVVKKKEKNFNRKLTKTSIFSQSRLKSLEKKY